jgi:bifunctional non-homologous end joining protein LigD
MISRNAHDRTEAYTHLADAVGQLPCRTALLDGEVVALDRRGVSRFQLLQRGSASVYAVFDCLYVDGRDLRREGLSERRGALEALVRPGRRLMLVRRLAKDGMAAYRVAKRRGYEGLVAKDLASPYVGGRSRAWLKVKVRQEDEFIIAGYTAPRGARERFGALLLGAYDGGQLHYVGKVGTGFTAATLASLSRAFRPLVRQTSPLVDPPRDRGVTYLAPKLVAEIAYEELTADRRLRQPSFLGLRDDKSPREVTLPEPQP